MWNLSKCRKIVPKGYALTVQLAIRYLVWIALVTFLALAHVYLRFSIRDLMIETRQIQQHKEELKNNQKVLISQTEYLKNDERMCVYATERLHLVHCKPSQIDHLVVSDALVSKYQKSPTLYRNKKFWEEEEPSAAEKILESISRIAQSSHATSRENF